MTTLPNRAHLAGTYPVPTWSQHMAALGGMYDVLAETVGIQPAQTMTLLGGKITPARGSVALETEGAAATDDLTTLGIDYIPEGRWLVLRANTAGRIITVKHQAGGTGQISLVGGADFLLNSLEKWLLLERQGSGWRELLRSYGTDTAAMRASMGITAPLEKANNLSDLSNKASARSNLGLAVVAASGAWSDLSGRPTLGVAAGQSAPNWALGEAAYLNVDEIEASTIRRGQVLQRVRSVSAAFLTSGATIPVDDTIPQITEGVEILTATITPQSSDSILRFTADVKACPPGGGFTVTLALHQADIADALAVSALQTAAIPTPLYLNHEMIAATTSAVTFSIRIGANGAVFGVNGGRFASLYGGALASSFLIEEIKQ